MSAFDWLSFTTDYGYSDGYVAACHGVIATGAPHARIIDVTHDIPPADVARGAAVLAGTVRSLPVSVHLAVVDPGVGTTRRGVLLDTGAGVLIGPDNGLLVPAAEALGGIIAAVEITAPDWRAAQVSATFHGRDIFAPAAARVATGAPVAEAGPMVDPATLVRLPEPTVRSGDGWIEAAVRMVDRFGNVQLAVDRARVRALAPAGAPLRVADRLAVQARTFGDVDPGELLVLVDSAGYAAVAVNQGDAAAVLGVTPGDVVRVAATA